jgi:hypothetical protein
MIRLSISDAPQDGRPILSFVDGEWMILRWYDRPETNSLGNVVYDTVTYDPGWINGDRDRSSSLNTSDRLLTYEPTHFYHLPAED